MAAILLTRPRAASENLARELARYGYASVIEPLLIVEPLATPQPDLSGIHAVMITSGNALETLEGRGIEEFLALPCFCVGERTAAKARAAGFDHVHAATADGIELARLIDGSQSGKKIQVLHICGRDIDSKAQDELVRCGHKVAGWPVYAAHPVQELTARTVRMLRGGQINVVIVFSVRTAETLKALLIRDGLETCCEAMIAIGLSEAVTNALGPLAWKKRIAVPVPTEDSMLECLRQTHPVS